jgi:hypothetical protein
MHSGPLFLTQATGRVGALGYITAFQYVVATAAALSAIVDNDPYSPLADGTLAVVNTFRGPKEIWALDTVSTAVPDGSTIVAAFSAGNWILISAQSISVALPQAAIIWQPGGVTVPNSNIVATWPEVETAVNYANGDMEVAIDTSITFPAPIPATSTLDGKGRLSFVSATGVLTQVTIAPGGQVKNFKSLENLSFESSITAPGLAPLVFNLGTVAQPQTLHLQRSIIQPTAGSNQGAMAVQTTRLLVQNDESSLIAGTGVEPAACVAFEAGAGTASVTIVSTTQSSLGDQSVRAPAGTAVFLLNDASVNFPTLAGQAGTVSYNWIDTAARVKFDDTLVAPAIVATTPLGGKEVQQALNVLKPFNQPFTFPVGPGPVVSVIHNKGQEFMFVAVYDNSVPPKMVLPDNVTAVSANQTDVDFASYTAGLTGTITVRI